jgi:hypothetical protein
MSGSSLIEKGLGSGVPSSGPTRYQTFDPNAARPNSVRTSFRDSMGYIGLSGLDSIRNSLSFGGKRVSVRDLGGKSTISKSSANLIKNLVGAGVLALPAGV